MRGSTKHDEEGTCLAHKRGFEPPTLAFVGLCSNPVELLVRIRICYLLDQCI